MIAIGGIGGSGTRLVAQMLKELDYYIGDDLNEPNDNLLFTLLFKHESILTLLDSEFDEIVDIFLTVMNSDRELGLSQQKLIEALTVNNRTLHNKEWLSKRIKNIKKGSSHELWGWKEPNTHIVIERFLSRMDDLKFIYVYRNGLDMAYSENQNQLKLWGNIFMNNQNIDISPKNSLKYWCIIFRRIEKLKQRFPDRVLLMDFDKLCLSPNQSIEMFLEFLNIKEYSNEKLKSLIKIPSSIGRYTKYPLTDFDKDDLECVDYIYKK